tara:strand:+ start:94 stop:378 length:285 start_codon:yes stop_codon:yes gene_type:complete
MTNKDTIDITKYEAHMTGYYFEGSNFDLESLTMYDSDGEYIALLSSANKRLMGGPPFLSPTLELMIDAPKILQALVDEREEVKKLRKELAHYKE